MMMAQTDPEADKRFIVSPKMSGPAQQPLEVYHLSHDLRGPLNSILGFSELLLEGIEGPLTEYQEADISAIYQSAQNLLRLINDLVDLSKLEADRLKFDLGPVELTAVVEAILSTDFGTNKPDQVELIASMPDDLPDVLGNRERVEQMIASLVHFAFKKVKVGQVIIIAARVDQAVTIQVSFGEEALADEEIAELFALGVHVDSAGRSELGPGGLAMPLAKGLVEKHQGELWVESEEGEGITFYLKLPVYEE
jgi:signal transduction histidine kinase